MFKNALLASISLLAVSVPIQQRETADTITLKPCEGLSLRRSFSRERITETEQVMEGLVGKIANEGTAILVVLDEVLAAEGGRATRLQRSYEELEKSSRYSVEAEWGDQSGSHEFGSKLDGESVTFEWNSGAEAYKKTSELEAVLVNDLRFDLDLIGLLPDGELEVGAEWTVDAEVFVEVLAFTEGIPWERAGAEDQAGAGVVEEAFAGELTLIYMGLRELDGAQLAVIKIEGDYEYDRVSDSSSAIEGGESRTHSETEETRSAKGELLWGVEHGHSHSLLLETEIESYSITDTVFDVGGEEYEHSTESSSTTTVTMKMTVERVAPK